MELRYADPRTLKENPENPRNVKPDKAYEDQLAENIRAIGLIQPPIVREIEGELVVKAGGRRRRACIAAGLESIPILVLDTDANADRMRAFAENLIRQGLATVDIYRTMQALAGDGWTNDAIATALSLPPRTVKRLKLCGNILPAILDHMATGDEPQTGHLRVIAQAPRDDQAQAWKKFKPRKGERVVWWELARALEKRRMWARDAKFGDDLVKAYGIVWVEDLFEQADGDSRYTTQVDAFLGAQHEWMTHNLPKRAIVLQVDDTGNAKLPPKAQRVWGKPGRGAVTGHFIKPSDGSVEIITYRIPDPPAKKGRSAKESDQAGASDGDTDVDMPVTKSRPPVTQTGQKMIGDFRTDALHKALLSDEIADEALIGLLVLAICAKNVEIRSPLAGAGYNHFTRDAIAGRIVPNGVLTQDPATLRDAAREALRIALGMRESNWGGNSGMVARIAGASVGADRYLPPMGTEEFLSCLSKAEIEAVAAANGVLPRQTGKATRAALVERFKDEPYVYPAARFELTAGEADSFAERAADAASCDAEDDEAGEEHSAGPDADSGETGPGTELEGEPVDVSEDADA